MDTLNHLTRAGVEKLPDLPSQDSPISPGRYVIKHPDQAYVAAHDDNIQTKTWFKSPPLSSETINRINGIKLFAESRDQGFCGDETAGNWTWLEVAIFESEASTSPKVTEDGVQLVWISHANKLSSEGFEWLQGAFFGEGRDILALLEEGNVIAVQICARFAAWHINARNGYLVIDIGDQHVERKSVYYGPIVAKINTMDEAFREVNVVANSAFQTSLPAGIKTAEIIERGSGERPLRVLCLDGGGIRGLSSLLLLKSVMDRLSPDGKLKPYEVFDMIGGTSTGGLIAIMLGRLHMTVDECIEYYQKFMGTVFKHGWFKKAKNLVNKGGLYSASTLERLIKDLFREKLGRDDVNLFNENEELAEGEHRCRIFVMAVRADAANNRGPVFLRSYTNPLDPSLVPNIKLWEAARATSAAPYYFTPIQVGKYKLVDGGLGANNPLGWLWTEILGVYGASRQTDCFLSIGTGIPSNKPVPEGGVTPTFGRIKGFAGIATNSEIMHVLFHGLIDSFAPKPITKKYWRLNVGEKIPEWEEDEDWWSKKSKELHLDDYKDVGEMDDLDAVKLLVTMTQAYVDTHIEPIEECVFSLSDKA